MFSLIDGRKSFVCPSVGCDQKCAKAANLGKHVARHHLDIAHKYAIVSYTSKNINFFSFFFHKENSFFKFYLSV
jgi:hypothetical protein